MPSQPRILVVEDEPAQRELLVDALAGCDFEVAAVATGKEAIELARAGRVDFVVTDLRLGDCTGLDVLDELRTREQDIPAVVMTGYGDARVMSEASRRRPVELMVKPLDVERLRSTIRRELTHRAAPCRWQRRTHRLRRVARAIDGDRRRAVEQLESARADLTAAHCKLNGLVSCQRILLHYQQELLTARNDDDVFRQFFRLLVRESGSMFGVALVCDAAAELQVIGRFGVPKPDGLRFGQMLSRPFVELLLASPRPTALDATDHTGLFDEAIRRYLVGVNVLAVPLMPSEGEMIAAAVLYRKGEQPFTDEDISLVELIAPPTALAVQRND